MVRRHISKHVKELFPPMREYVPTAQIAKLTRVSGRTVRRVLRLHRMTGSVVKTPIIAGQPRRLDNLEASFLEGCVLRRPDLYVRELQELLYRHCQIWVSESTVIRTLWRRGLSWKKVTRAAAERDEEDRQQYRWIIAAGYHAYQLVFVDESAADRRTTRRGFAWSPIGTRATIRDSLNRGLRYSILPALSLDGILHCVIRPGSFNSIAFNDFILGLLDMMNPFPGPNSVIVMDNANIHKSAEMRERVEARDVEGALLGAWEDLLVSGGPWEK